MLHRGCFLALVALCLGLASEPAPAQVVRLPAVEPPAMEHPGQLLSYPDSGAEVLQPPLAPAQPPDPDRPPDARDGVFQKLILNTTWLAPGGAEGLGMSNVELKTVLALPIPSRTWPLIITPGFGVHYLDGPKVSDLPPRVYDAYTQFRSMGRLNPRWAADLAVTVGAYSDFQQSSDEALRITGHGAAMFTWNPTTKLLFGVAYLDRKDVSVLPIGGIIWTPTPDLAFELAAPRPKIARRVYWAGAVTEEVQDWVYIAGEYGGGTWAIRRADDTNDQVTYSDYRVLLGMERRRIAGLDASLEVGYVFGRRLEYASGDPTVKPDGTVVLGGSLVY